MATVFWVGNSIATSQVDTITITAVNPGGTITVTMNGKPLTYTCITGDTTSTAALSLQAILSGVTAPPEFSEPTWSVSGAVVTATASVPGTPFTITSAVGAGGATCTLAHPTVNASPSDVGLAANWLRAGSPAIPQNGDDVIIGDSSVPLLWNLTALAAVQFATFRRWQSFTGSIGLPENNPLGYYEYRPTYFQFVGSGTLAMTLGETVGSGSGPSRERYDLGAQRYTCTVLASGSSQDDYAIRIKGSNVNNVLNVTGTSVGVAMLPGETATLASANVDGGGTLALGSGVTFSGTLKATSASLVVNCAPAAINCYGGCQLTVGSLTLTYVSITADQSTQITWLSDSTITTIVLSRASRFDKSLDLRNMTIVNSTMDADCQFNDPNSNIAWTNATLIHGQVASGPFVITGDRTIKVT